jgi:NAD(P)H-dependent FMN reductase
MTVVSVIVGSTREGRFSEKPAWWILRRYAISQPSVGFLFEQAEPIQASSSRR